MSSKGVTCVVVVQQQPAGARGQRDGEQGERAAVGGRGRVPRRLRQRVGARRRQAGAQGEPQHQAGAAPRPSGTHQQV